MLSLLSEKSMNSKSKLKGLLGNFSTGDTEEYGGMDLAK